MYRHLLPVAFVIPITLARFPCAGHPAKIPPVQFNSDSAKCPAQHVNRPASYPVLFALISILVALAGPHCSKSPTSGSRAGSGGWDAQDSVVRERLAKDAAFKGESSPLPQQDRARFQGLEYYPVNPDLRFPVKLNRHPIPEQVRLGTNTGEIRSALRYGYFEFQVDGRICRLQAYRIEDAADHGATLFIPFRDATSGRETYGAGRYIDLKENTSGSYDLDFNRAYNPYCAFDSKYSCPVPPAENTLPVAIRAGEKNYSAAH